MPLNLPGLKTSLQTQFANPGTTAALCADHWGASMEAYASAVVPPSLAVSTAATALKAALALAFVAPGPSVVAAVEAAFTAFAVAVGVGMAPAFVATPPPGPVGFAVEFAKLPGAWAQTHAAAAILWGNMINTWMTTGTAVAAGPPTPPIPWS